MEYYTCIVCVNIYIHERYFMSSTYYIAASHTLVTMVTEQSALNRLTQSEAERFVFTFRTISGIISPIILTIDSCPEFHTDYPGAPNENFGILHDVRWN